MPPVSPVRDLILLLGDQLTPSLSSLAQADKAQDRLLMVEVMDEATYVPHHKKKLAFVFSAMRHFAQELRALGWQLDYVTLDDPANQGSFVGEVARAVERLQPHRVVLTEPSEWRVREALNAYEQLPDDRFLCSHDQFETWADGRKQLRMEFFYRDMRRRTGLLMEADGTPTGGQWNYDAQNRKAAAPDLFLPEPARFAPDAITAEVLAMVAKRFPHHFGDLEPFWFAVTRADAETAFARFLKQSLAQFGDFQDAMLHGAKFLHHSVISQYLNIGLLDPLALCRAVEAEYRAGRAPLNAVEGYIRQIIGWREYVRGIYWLKMPGYAQENVFGNTRPLPDFYWTAETDMACIRACVTQTREEAYAHHIQRLMVTGTFALLAGIDPHAVHEWYLLVYADAYEWVEMPNTLGMSQYADGGLLASKPYAASGAYIDKMSNYCRGCCYDVKLKSGEDACPFNRLYWDFLGRNREQLRKNQRLAQMYATYERMGAVRHADIAADAAALLSKLDRGARV